MANGHPVKKFRLTEKVKEACEILGSEHISDLGAETFEQLIVKGKLDYQHVYVGMTQLGYKWHEVRQIWIRNIPHWLSAIIEQENKKILHGWRNGK